MERRRPILPVRWAGSLAIVIALVSIPAGAGTASAGTIVGTVYFHGTPPPVKKMPVDKDNDVCGTGFREIVEVNVGPENTLGDIVVCVKGGDDGGGLHFEMPEKGFRLNQKGCRFVPDIMIIPAGEKLTITNRDPIIHNIHTYEIIKGRRRDMFNFAQPERGHRRVEKIKPRRSDTVELTCEVHAFMHGWIYVSDGSACVISKDGHFKIADVPDGTYTVKVWHPTLGVQEAEVTVAGAEEVRVDFQYTASE